MPRSRRVAAIPVLLSALAMVGAACAAPSASPSPSIIASPAASAGPSLSPSPGPTPLPADAALPEGVIAYTVGRPYALGVEPWIGLVAPDGTDPVQLVDGWDPAWAPEGRLFFTCPGGKDAAGADALAVCSIDPGGAGGAAVVLALGDDPEVSPDGTRIVFHRGMIDVGETWIANADGTAPRLLTSGEITRWSPDGRWLAGQPESAAYEVAVVAAADASGSPRVLDGGGDPAWSPDGRSVIYAHVDATGGALRVVDVETGTISLRYLAPTGGSVGRPLWLADGRIVFVLDGDLWRLDPGVTSAVQLTNGLSIVDGPSLSPDGEWVAVATETAGEGSPARLAIVSLAGGWRVLDLATGGQRPLMSASQPAWMPAPTR